MTKRKRSKRNYKKYAGAYKSWVTCICPRCPEDKKYHQFRMFWTGNGHPRIFCPAHKALPDYDDLHEDVKVHVNKTLRT